MNDYNGINPDIGYIFIEKKELLPILQNLKDCWIKVKTISKYCHGNKLEELWICIFQNLFLILK